MKYWLNLLVCFSVLSVTAQNVGIGTATPAARLHVADSAVLFTGPASIAPSTSFAPPASGGGTRMMWYPQKAAFRSGFVFGNNWDKDNIGLYSVAMGSNSKASGEAAVSLGISSVASGRYSLAMGAGTTASNEGSTSMGYLTTASGVASTAMGFLTTASGEHSVSMGNRTIAGGFTSAALGMETYASGASSIAGGQYTLAGGENSFAMGFQSFAFGRISTAIGFLAVANGEYAISMGSSTKASGTSSMAVGSYTIARSNNSLVAGTYNDTSSTTSLFEIGNGTANNARSNAFTVLANGNTGIGITNPTSPLSFPPTLQKKISFYPGATGDVGISVSGNDLRIYSDNVNARVSFGYDSYTSGFISRAFVPASGTNALVVQGNLLVNSTTYSSDARFKQNIRPLTGSLEKILALQGVQYEMRVNEFPGRNFQPGTELGLIAQEVEKVFPELVGTDTEGYKSVDYAKLVPLLIESVKTQQVQLQKQEEQVRLQQEKIDRLLLRLEKLERSAKQQ